LEVAALIVVDGSDGLRNSAVASIGDRNNWPSSEVYAALQTILFTLKAPVALVFASAKLLCMAQTACKQSSLVHRQQSVSISVSFSEVVFGCPAFVWR